MPTGEKGVAWANKVTYEQGEAEIAQEIEKILAHIQWRTECCLDTVWSTLMEPMIKVIRDIKNNPASIKEKIKRRTKLVEQIAEEMEAKTQEFYDNYCPEHLKAVLCAGTSRRHVYFIQRMIEVIGHEDKELARDIMNGFTSLGVFSKTGLWPDDPLFKEKVADPDLDVKLLYNMARKIRSKAPGFMDQELVDHVLTEILEDIEHGRYTEISKDELLYDKGAIPPAYAFAIRQKAKMRTIIDRRLQNKFSPVPEKLRLLGSRTIWEIIQCYSVPVGDEEKTLRAPRTQASREAHVAMTEQLTRIKEGSEEDVMVAGATTGSIKEGQIKRNRNTKKKRKGVIPEIIAEDWKKAYYLFGIKDPKLAPLCAWDSKTEDYRCFRSNVLDMGNALSVPAFLRISEFMMKVLLWAYIPSVVYIDDSTLIAHPDLAEVSHEFFRVFNRCMGMWIADAKTQTTMANELVTILGLEYIKDGKRMVCRVPAEKIERCRVLLNIVLKQLEEKALVLKDIQKAVGLVSFCVTSQDTRAGMQVLRPMYKWANEESFERLKTNRYCKRVLKRSISAVMLLLDEVRDIEFSVERGATETIFIFTDASTDGSKDGRAQMGGLLLDVDGCWEAWTAASDGENIAELELMAVQRSFEHWREKTKDRLVIVGVDNANAMYAAIKCDSKQPYLARHANKMAVENFANKTAVRYEYIYTKFNPADCLTRWQREGLLIKALQDANGEKGLNIATLDDVNRDTGPKTLEELELREIDQEILAAIREDAHGVPQITDGDTRGAQAPLLAGQSSGPH